MSESQLPAHLRTYRRTATSHMLIADSRTSPSQANAVLAMHGWGQAGSVMYRRSLQAMQLFPALWVFPDGFHAFEIQSGRRIGHAWYLFDGQQESLRASMLESSQWLDELCQQVQADAGSAELTWSVIGFSQGGYLSGVFATHASVNVSRVLCISGRFKHEFFGERNRGLRLLQVHGEQDASVTLERATDALEACRGRGYSAELQVIAGEEHRLSTEMMERAAQWLAE